jgi:hypothetical protein
VKAGQNGPPFSISVSDLTKNFCYNGGIGKSEIPIRDANRVKRSILPQIPTGRAILINFYFGVFL